MICFEIAGIYFQEEIDKQIFLLFFIIEEKKSSSKEKNSIFEFYRGGNEKENFNLFGIFFNFR